MNTTSIKQEMNQALQWSASGSKLTYASIAIGLLVALIVFRVFFRNLAGFVHCIGFSLGQAPKELGVKPEMSKSSRVKLLLGTLLPAGSAYAAYLLLPRWFPSFFQ